VTTEAQLATKAKLLVVEDDALIRMLLADMLGEIGYTVAAEATSIDEALEATRGTDFDLALLDADLQGQSVWPVADALVARDIGFIFVTGSDHGLFAYRDRPTLKKPFQIDALKRCCRSALSPPAAIREL
jgi:CheY-like chemotaxis protein